MTRWIPLLIALSAAPAHAQAFTSGSDGSDGPLNVTTSADFDPAALGIDGDADGIYNFTTIDVAAGVTLRLRASILGEGKPVVWLASGAVTIAGTLNLDGAPGHPTDTVPLPSEAGAGGFSGGIGRTALARATSGSGPGGGLVGANTNGGGAGHAFPGQSSGVAGNGGPAYGNVFLLPLIGGSGGAGFDLELTVGTRGGGGAGGGAILIASDTSITVTGAINARGGASGSIHGGSGSGSGGAIRLIAPTCSGAGALRVDGNLGGIDSSPGRIRVEALTHQLSNVSPLTVATFARPGVVLLPANAPRVRATQITLADGTTVPIPPDPKGGFVIPDAVVNTTEPMTLTLAAENIPTGTQVQVRIVPEGGAAIVLTSMPLSGTKASSTATTASFSLPTGFTRFSISASFTP